MHYSVLVGKKLSYLVNSMQMCMTDDDSLNLVLLNRKKNCSDKERQLNYVTNKQTNAKVGDDLRLKCNIEKMPFTVCPGSLKISYYFGFR